MRRWLIAVGCWLLLAGCSGPTPEEQATQAARDYYARLLEGYPDGLLAAKAGADALPADYQEQLEGVYRQYVADIQAKHGGLRAVAVSDNPARMDSVQKMVYVFLMLSFNDSTQEEVTVPMVKVGDEWYIK